MKPHHVLAAVLVLAFAPLFACADAAVKWRHIPGLAGPAHAGMQLGDFDGNGRKELVATAWGRESFGFNADQMLVVHQPFNGPGSEIRRTHLSLWKEGFTSSIVLITRPGRKDALMTTIQPAGGPATMLLLSGIPLQVEREIPVPLGFRPWLVADIDVDGDQEVVGLIHQSNGNGTALVVIDFASGAVSWEQTISALSVATIQLDDDAALELILSGTPGHIVDGATQAIEVTYPAGFGRFLAVGNFDLDPQTQEFITSEGWYNPQIFRGRPFSPIGEVQAEFGGAILAHDINNDGTTDLVIGSNQNGPLRIMDPVTGATLLSMTPSVGGGTSGLTIGDIDGLPGDELAFSAGLGSTDSDGLYVYTLPDLVNLHFSADVASPHSSTLLADVDADGAEEALFVGSTSDGTYSGPRVYILDGETGLLRNNPRLVDTFHVPFVAPAGLFASQLDEDPQLEIGVGLNQSGFSPAVGLLDGHFLNSEWSSNAASFRSLDTVIADLAGNGASKIVGATVDARLFVLNPETGLSEWSSEPLSQFSANALAVGNIDGDAAAEMVISIGGETYAFDGVTKLLEWSMSTASPIKGWQIWGTGADCRLAAWVGMAMIVYRCSDRSIVDSISLPSTSVSGQVIDKTQLLVAVANDGRLQVIKPGTGTIYSSPYFGVGLGTANRGFIRATGPGCFEALMGSNAQVVRFDFDLDDLHGDGFE
jgi:hypothetical protein